MGLFRSIVEAVSADRYLLTVHAKKRCLERGVADWQLLADIERAEVLEDRSDDAPNPPLVVRQLLVDGTEVKVVWAYNPESGRALLVTVYFPD